MKLRDNKGVTLVELMVSIAIGTMVVLAVTTVMLLGLKIYSASNKVALKQQKVRMAITVMENLASEATDVAVLQGTKEVTASGRTLLKQDGNTIVTGAGQVILEDVDDFAAQMDDDLLTIKCKMNEITGARIRFDHEIRNEAGELINTGFVELVFVNTTTRRPCHAPQWFVDLFNKE